MTNKSAHLLLEEKREISGFRFEMVAWEVPTSEHYPHGISYRFWFGNARDTLVLYDVHHGKPYHKHLAGKVFPYEFTDLNALIDDFLADTEVFR
ncbi:hypothetical protein F3N42_14010 [Marinihelvus fidelis]|uniref:Uncharacterized protein n=1 Tax=Marinihelvus fidelis TaxID=2613842 RepID=A0A5N0T487_9GAMM|nr:DUF6516 family protein [Marinihelvus fidelis]KAA9129890.1 hypothetical protein F3N42_14010 [Marinihelvus fidelis]